MTPATARAMAEALTAYADALDKGRDGDDFAFLVCEAAFKVTDDGDFYGWQQHLCDERGWDSDGNPVDEDGFEVGLPRLYIAPARVDLWWRGAGL